VRQRTLRRREERTEEDRLALRTSEEYFRNDSEGIPFEQVPAELGFTMEQIPAKSKVGCVVLAADPDSSMASTALSHRVVRAPWSFRWRSSRGFPS
jgi:hypothetical protein